MYKRILFVLILFPGIINSFAQESEDIGTTDTTILLLSDMIVQIESTEAVNDMYNFKFPKAEQQFRWLKQKYPQHPLSYFLLGLSQWWKMMPDVSEKRYDRMFLHYMDTSIIISEKMLEKKETRIEGAFFLAAAYGFKGRFHSDRGNWGKAAAAGKSSLNYLDISKEKSGLSPELLFGDALYNYYSIWIGENYTYLKPIMLFFPNGDKELGLKQLKEVSLNAFYTRIEAKLFLMRILASDYKDYYSALKIAEYLHEIFPDNPYFHRYYTRYLYSVNRMIEMENEAKKIIYRVDSGMVGYEATSGRYAAFFLGQMYEAKRNIPEAKVYYEKAVAYGEENEAYETGYYLYSLVNLGKFADKEGDKKSSRQYFKAVKKHANRRSPAHKAVRNYLKSRS